MSWVRFPSPAPDFSNECAHLASSDRVGEGNRKGNLGSKPDVWRQKVPRKSRAVFRRCSRTRSAVPRSTWRPPSGLGASRLEPLLSFRLILIRAAARVSAHSGDDLLTRYGAKRRIRRAPAGRCERRPKSCAPPPAKFRRIDDLFRSTAPGYAGRDASS